MASTLKIRGAKTAAVASLALFMSAGVVSAAQATEAGGVAEASGGASVLACENVGGGTWCHGTEPDGLLQHCYSNYLHNSNYHSATAIVGSVTDRRYADAGSWARAAINSGWAYTCYTYYNEDA